MSTANGRRHMALVAKLPCVLCETLGQGPAAAHVHHIREGQGASQRASDFLTIPLCPECHQGRHGIHGDRALLRVAKMTELDLLAVTVERLLHRGAR